MQHLILNLNAFIAEGLANATACMDVLKQRSSGATLTFTLENPDGLTQPGAAVITVELHSDGTYTLQSKGIDGHVYKNTSHKHC